MDRFDPIPVAAGLFEGKGEDAHLVGSCCRGCGAHYFPQALSCRNPACVSKKIEPAALSREGVLYSFTRQSYRPPALFKMDPWAPYTIGLIELPEGLRVMAMLCDVDPPALRVGMPMVLTVRPLYQDEQGRDVLTYQFKPAQASEASI